ncbi:MAG: hypothetical protein DRP42_05000, partial [Tenericutes bacterium]
METLNIEQKETYIGIMESAGNNLLTARGGCGKTYLTAKIILAKAKEDCYITIVAPSHTARSVLEKELTTQCDGDPLWNGARDKIETMTVASALGKRPDFSKAPKSYKDTPFTTSKDGGKLRDNCPKDKNRLLVVEEISMVGKDEMESIFHQWGKAPILMVGDFRQIPPVNNVSSRALLAKKYKSGALEHFKLVVNERSSKDTDIALYSDIIFNTFNKDFAGVGTPHRGVFEYDNAEAFDQT